MKRTISWVLILVLVLSLFAGCSNSNTEPTNATAAPTDAVVAADENLANAIAYLKAYYKEVKDGDLTPADYERLGTVRVGTTAYEVVYTVDCDETAVKVVKGDGMVTMDVNEESDVEVPYVLTATITGTDGATASLSWKHVVPAVMNSDEIIDAAYALEDGEALGYEATLTGEIISIDTPYSADYKNITVSIKVAGREDKPIMCYRLKGEGADALTVGDIITVTGTLKNYKGTIEFDAGCTLDKVEKGENSVEIPTDPQEILEAAFALGYGESLPYNATLTGKIVGIGDKYSEQYNNITVTIKTGEPWYCVTCFRMKGEGVDKIWLDDEITVTGSLTNYNGTIEFNSGCQLVSWIDNPDPKAPSDPAKIIDEAYTTLNHRDTLPYPCSLTGTVIGIEDAWSHEYQNISVWMSVPGSENQPILCYRTSGRNAWDIEVGDTITVYGWLMNYNGTIEFMQGSAVQNIVKSTAPLTGLAKDVKAASELESGKSLSYKTTVLNGTIMDTPYESSYEDSKGSWKFTVSDGTASVLCYYVPVTGGTPKKGDTITVEGYLKNYDGTVEFTSSAIAILGGGAVPEAPAVEEPADGSTLTVAEAVALGNKFGKDEYSTGKFYITGEISDITQDYYGNMKIKDSTGSIEIYGTYDKDGSTKYGDMATKPQVGDTITVYGVIGKYYSAQMKNGVITNHVSSAPATYTVTCNTAENGAVSVDPAQFEVGATVTLAVNPAEGYELDTLTVTGANGADVTVTGTTFTMPEANVTVTATFKAAVVTYTVTCATAENGTVTADKTSATKGETITLTVTPADGYKLDTLTVKDANDAEVTVTSTTFAMPEADVTVTATFRGITIWEKVDALGTDQYLSEVSEFTTTLSACYSMNSDGVSRNVGITVDGNYLICNAITGTGVDKLTKGDTVTLRGYLGKDYKNRLVLKKGAELVSWVDNTPDVVEPPSGPLSIAEAIALGEKFAKDNYSTNVYTITGQITEITSTKYGNMYIKDSTGSILVYGTYDTSGNRYDAMTTKPQVGDTVTVSGVIGYYSSAQMKNGTITSHIPASN